MIEQEESLAAAAEINDVAVALRQLSHILERIAAHREKSDAEKIGARPGRKLRCIGHGSRSLNGLAVCNQPKPRSRWLKMPESPAGHDFSRAVSDSYDLSSRAKRDRPRAVARG